MGLLRASSRRPETDSGRHLDAIRRTARWFSRRDHTNGNQTAMSDTGAASLEACLAAEHAAMEAWQVRALFLGALASTNMRLGPQHLFPHILGEDHSFESMENVQTLMGGLMALWNALASEVLTERGAQLSTLSLGQAPSRAKLLAYAARREEELRCFVLGVDTGGDDPAEFGDEGKELFQRLGEARGFYRGYREALAKIPAGETEEERAKTWRVLGELTATVETLLTDLLRVGQAVRAQAIAAYQEFSARGATDDGFGSRSEKVGRNAPCPCGSGRKFKRCCGGGGPVVH